jgi:hypothetical protein
VGKCFGDNDPKTFRMRREYKQLRVEEGRLLMCSSSEAVKPAWRPDQAIFRQT